MRFSTSVRVLVASLFLMVACGEEEEPGLENGGGFITIDGGTVYDAGANGGAFDASGFPAFDASGFPGFDASGLFDGGFGGGDAALTDGGSVGADGAVQIDGSVAADGGTDSGSADGGSADGGTAGGPYVRGPEPTSASASAKGPYNVMSYTSGLADGADFSGATVYYPSDATAPFAMVAVCPGFLSGEDTVRPWGPFLASHGIVAVTIGTNTGGEQPAERARALLQALKALAGENTRTGSPLLGKLDASRQATVGWSMGGGGSLLAAEQTPTLKAAISLAGWNPTYTYSKVTVPAMMLAVKGDDLAGAQSQRFYNAIPASTPKLLWEVQGVGSFFAGHDNLNDPLGVTNGVAGRLGLSWLKVFLEGDTRYKQFLPVKPATSTDFQTNVTL